MTVRDAIPKWVHGYLLNTSGADRLHVEADGDGYHLTFVYHQSDGGCIGVRERIIPCSTEKLSAVAHGVLAKVDQVRSRESEAARIG